MLYLKDMFIEFKKKEDKKLFSNWQYKEIFHMTDEEYFSHYFENLNYENFWEKLGNGDFEEGSYSLTMQIPNKISGLEC